MKIRTSKILNFIAFNLLFFSLYLNFFKKESNSLLPASPGAGFEIQLVNTKQYESKHSEAQNKSQEHSKNTNELKISIN